MLNNENEILNKRKLKSIYSTITLNVMFLIIFLVIIYISIPGYKNISLEKDLLKQEINNFEKIQKNGFSYEDIKKENLTPDFLSTINKIGNDFFDKNLVNTDEKKDYLKFLNEKEQYIIKLKKTDKIQQRDKKLSKVLPFYNEGYFVEGNMTDLEFINYVELLLRSFGLKTSSKIGISEVSLVKDDKDNTSSQIFYIPLELELEGRKSSIIEFLYFIQNVGNIIAVSNEDIVFYKDNILNKVLEGQIKTSNYNIYENKLIDIKEIEFSDYIDTSIERRDLNNKTVDSFISFIRNGQEKDDSYKIKVTLRFYVRGLPTYKLVLFIEDVLKKYDNLNKKTKSLLLQAQNRNKVNLTNDILQAINSIKTIDIFLQDKSNEVEKIKRLLKQNSNIEKLYVDATNLKYELDSIGSILDQNELKLKQNKK